MNKRFLFGIVLMVLLVLPLSLGVIDWSTDVVSYIPLNDVGESTGLIDLSSNGNNMTAYEGVSIDSSGDYFAFDGTDDYLKLSDIIDTSSQDGLTISAWYYPESANEGYGGVSLGTKKSGGLQQAWYVASQTFWSLFAEVDGVPSDYIIPSDTLNYNSWVHVVHTFSEDEIQIFFNGTEDTTTQIGISAEFSEITGASADDYYIGGISSSSSSDLLNKYFDGRMSDVVLFDRVLTDTEISDLYDEGRQYTPYDVTPGNFTIYADNFYDDSSINTFWAYIGGVNYTTTTGSVVTPFYMNDTSTYSLVVGSSDYFSETYSGVVLTSDFVSVLHQSEISFASFELFTDSALSNVSYVIDGVENTTFYLSAGNYSVLVDPLGYYAKNFTFTVVAGDILTKNITGFYNVVLYINLTDIVTTDLVEAVSYVDVGVFGNSSAVNGSLSIFLIDGNYSLSMWADDYAFNYVNLSLSAGVSSYSYGLYANNSVWVTAYDFDSGVALTNFSAEVYNSSLSFTAVAVGGVAKLSNVTSGVYSLRVSQNDYSSASYSLIMTGGSHQSVAAYLVASGGSTAIFTVVNSLSSSIVEGVSGSMYKLINGTYSLVSSQLSDITGRIQYTYTPDITYKFIFSNDGFTNKTFFLKPLFSAYTVRLVPDIESNPDVNVGGWIYSINNSGEFFDGVTNDFSIDVISGMGGLEYYYVNVTSPTGGVVREISCYLAGGCSNITNLSISGAVADDVVSVELWVKESGRGLKYFSYDYLVTGVYTDTTMRAWRDADMGSLEAVLAASLILLILVGVVAGVASLMGGPVITITALVLGFGAELLGKGVGLFPPAVGHLIALGCLLIVIFGRGEI